MRALHFIETPVFKAYIDKLLNAEEQRALQNELIINPTKGKLIRQSGGIRKLRFNDPTRGKGKRGGIRVLYYLDRQDAYMLLAYSKKERDNLSAAQLKALRIMVKDNL